MRRSNDATIKLGKYINDSFSFIKTPSYMFSPNAPNNFYTINDRIYKLLAVNKHNGNIIFRSREAKHLKQFYTANLKNDNSIYQYTEKI